MSELYEPNPSGLCMCGCGGTTPLAKQTRTHIGHVRGKHVSFILGHNRRSSPVEYIEQDCGYVTPCWVWQRTKTKGYGMVQSDGVMKLAHRVFYEKVYGLIPAGLHLDHLCRNRACVNPAHLEVVTNAENCRRGSNAKLNKQMVAEIKEARSHKIRVVDIAETYGVSTYAIYRVLNGSSWCDEI